MTLLAVVQDVCAAVGVAVPTSVFSSIAANRTMQEMLSLANEMAQRIAADTRDWTALKLLHSYAGDDVTTAFDLPANYRRMLLTTNVWRNISPTSPMRFFPDADMWVRRRALGQTDGHGEWTLIGGQMHIFPALPLHASASFIYYSKNCVRLAAGGFGDAFMTDGDGFVLDERLLKLGMIWQWKAHKGSPYAEDMGSYGDALTNAMGRDSPAPILSGGYPVDGWGGLTNAYFQ